MRNQYLKILQTPAVETVQHDTYGRAHQSRESTTAGELGESEANFIEARDSFYISSMSSSGWPYLQHRGGPAGFLKVIGPRQLAYADREGNRQLISIGNLSENDRVSLFLMDYRARERLKLLGHARVALAKAHPDIAAKLGVESSDTRIVLIDVVGYDWNCPKYITQRFTREEVEAVFGQAPQEKSIH